MNDSKPTYEIGDRVWLNGLTGTVDNISAAGDRVWVQWDGRDGLDVYPLRAMLVPPRIVKNEPVSKVVRPPYYGGPENPYEVWKVLEKWGFYENYLRADAIVYLARAGKKDPTQTVDDLEKAVACIKEEIRYLQSKA